MPPDPKGGCAPLVLKARHLNGSAFCTGFSKLEVPEQALGGMPLRHVGMIVKIHLLNFHTICAH